MKKEKSNRTTEKDFQVFIEEFKYWIKYFGLLNYKFVFFHEFIEDNAGRATFHKNRASRVIRVSLNTNWKNHRIDNYQLRVTSFHEFMESLLLEMADMVYHGYGEFNEENETHKLIRIFENTIFEEHYQKRFGNDRNSDTEYPVRKRSGGKRKQSVFRSDKNN